MPFLYTGVESTFDVEVFTTILVAAVEDTAAAYGFTPTMDYGNADQSFLRFRELVVDFMTMGARSNKVRLLGVAALATHCVSLHPVIEPRPFAYPRSTITNLAEARLARNPCDLVALSFGLSIIETQMHCENADGRIMYGPVIRTTKASAPSAVLRAVNLIATNRNIDLRAGQVEARRAFRRIGRLVGTLKPVKSGLSSL